MKRIFRNALIVLTAVVMVATMTSSVFATAMPTSLDATISLSLTVTGAGSKSGSFKVTSAGNVKIAASVYYIVQPNTSTCLVESNVYIYNDMGDLYSTIKLNKAYMANSTSETLTSLTYTGSDTVCMPTGTYYVVATTLNATDGFTSIFSVGA